MSKYRINSKVDRLSLKTWYWVEKRLFYFFWKPVGNESGILVEYKRFTKLEEVKEYLENIKLLKL